MFAIEVCEDTWQVAESAKAFLDQDGEIRIVSSYEALQDELEAQDPLHAKYPDVTKWFGSGPGNNIAVKPDKVYGIHRSGLASTTSWQSALGYSRDSGDPVAYTGELPPEVTSQFPPIQDGGKANRARWNSMSFPLGDHLVVTTPSNPTGSTISFNPDAAKKCKTRKKRVDKGEEVIQPQSLWLLRKIRKWIEHEWGEGVWVANKIAKQWAAPQGLGPIKSVRMPAYRSIGEYTPCEVAFYRANRMIDLVTKILGTKKFIHLFRAEIKHGAAGIAATRKKHGKKIGKFEEFFLSRLAEFEAKRKKWKLGSAVVDLSPFEYVGELDPKYKQETGHIWIPRGEHNE